MTPSRAPLDPDAARLLATIAAVDEPELTSITPQEARRLRAERYGPGSTPVVSIDDASLGGVACTVYRGVATPAPCIVWLHGGGWVMGGRTTHDELFRSIASGTGCHVVAPEYRLAPEHRFPAAIDDGLAVLDAVAGGALPGVVAGRLVLGGDSAGGNLAVGVAATSTVRADALVLAYPVTDARCESPEYALDHASSYLRPEWMRWFAAHYLGPDGDATDWRASPLLAPSEVLARLPETLLYVAGHDPLRHEGVAFGARLGAAGVAVDVREVADLPHGFLGFAGAVPSARRHLGDLTDWIVRRLGTPPVGNAGATLPHN